MLRTRSFDLVSRAHELENKVPKGKGSIGAELHALEQDRAIKTDPDETKRRRTIRLVRSGGQTWGFTLQTYGIRNKRTREVEIMSYVDYVDIDRAAWVAGMRRGDIILSINGESVETCTHRDLVRRIQQSQHELRLVVLFENCCQKVELHERYLSLKKMLSQKLKELRALEADERLISQGMTLSRLDAFRQSNYSSSSSDWDIYSEIISPSVFDNHPTNQFVFNCNQSLSDMSMDSSSFSILHDHSSSSSSSNTSNNSCSKVISLNGAGDSCVEVERDGAGDSCQRDCESDFQQKNGDKFLFSDVSSLPQSLSCHCVEHLPQPDVKSMTFNTKQINQSKLCFVSESRIDQVPREDESQWFQLAEPNSNQTLNQSTEYEEQVKESLQIICEEQMRKSLQYEDEKIKSGCRGDIRHSLERSEVFDLQSDHDIFLQSRDTNENQSSFASIRGTTTILTQASDMDDLVHDSYIFFGMDKCPTYKTSENTFTQTTQQLNISHLLFAKLSDQQMAGPIEHNQEQDVGPVELNEEKDVGFIELNQEKDAGSVELNLEQDVGPVELNEEKNVGSIELNQEKDVGSIELNLEQDVDPVELNEEKDVGSIELNQEKDVGSIELNQEQDVGHAENIPVSLLCLTKTQNLPEKKCINGVLVNDDDYSTRL